MYVGQSKNIEDRWKQHLRSQGRKNSYIDDAIYKYGDENFTLSIICELEKDDDLLNAMEEYYIWKYNTYKDKNHYNLTPGGDFNPAKLPEVQAKISKALSGRKLPQKTKDKLSKANYGEKNPFFGRKHSQRTKEKISKAKLGNKLSNEHKINVSKVSNTSGYYRVHKDKCKRCKQGFTFVYRYHENGKRKKISSVDIKKLEQKVKAKGLEWIKFDE